MPYVSMLFENQFAAAAVWLTGFAAVGGLALEIKYRFKTGLPTALFSASLTLLNFIYWGTYVNFAAAQGTAFFAGLLLLFLRRNELAAEKVTALSLLCLALAAACVSIGAVPFAWDEFFWSLFDKHISQFSAYWDTGSAILLSHVRYMPGSALWHNFFGAPGRYSEATAYFANAALLIPIVYFLAGQAKRENRFFLGAAVVLALGCFSEGLFNLYTDQFLGLFFGLCLLTGTRYFSGEKEALLPFILSLSGSLLFKETGLIPVLALFFTLVLVFAARVKLQPGIKGALYALGYCFLALAAWKLYLRHTGAVNVMQLRMFTDFSPQMTDKYAAVLAEFAGRMFTSYDLLACWLLTFLAFRAEKGTPGAGIKLTYVSLSILGFLAIHLVSWLFLTVDNDGRTLAAFNRYMGSLLLGLFVYYVSLLSARVTLGLKHKVLICVLLAWVPLNLVWQGYTPSSLFRLVSPHPKQVPIMKKKLAALKETMPAEIYGLCEKERPKIWFIYQDSNGLEAMMARHLLAPCQVSANYWSIGDRYYPEDVWTADLGKDAFLELAREYPLMVIARGDGKLARRYGGFFDTEPQSGRMYLFDDKAGRFRLK